MNFRQIFLLLPLFILMFSCSGDDIENDESNKQFKYYQNRELILLERDDLNYEVNVQNAEKIVFEYIISEDPIPEAADDEYTKKLYFQIDSDQTSFELNAENFEEHKAVLGIFCFCGVTGYAKVEEGYISGKKIGDERWEVKFNIKATLIRFENNTIEISEEDAGIFVRGFAGDL